MVAVYEHLCYRCGGGNCLFYLLDVLAPRILYLSFAANQIYIFRVRYLHVLSDYVAALRQYRNSVGLLANLLLGSEENLVKSFAIANIIATFI